VISRKFRGKFLYLLKQAFNNRELTFFNDATKLSSKDTFLAFLDNLYSKEWVVFSKKPFKSPAHVVKYLGRYTHRVAISNSRIKSFDGKKVSFAWKDYKDGNKSKVMTLSASEFTRRFLLHVLPDRLTKIRHYGLLSSRNIKTKLLKCMHLTRTKPSKLASRPYTKTCRECGGSHFVTFLLPKPTCASPWCFFNRILYLNCLFIGEGEGLPIMSILLYSAYLFLVRFSLIILYWAISTRRKKIEFP